MLIGVEVEVEVMVLPSYMVPPIRVLLLWPVEQHDPTDRALLPPGEVARDQLMGTILPAPREGPGAVVAVVTVEDIKGKPRDMYAQVFSKAPMYSTQLPPPPPGSKGWSGGDQQQQQEQEGVDGSNGALEEVQQWGYVGPCTLVMVEGIGCHWVAPSPLLDASDVIRLVGG